MPLWQQMRTMEILSATMAADLIANRIIFSVEKEEISWPNGYLSKAPTNSKSKGKKKLVPLANMAYLVKLSMNMVLKAQVLSHLMLQLLSTRNRTMKVNMILLTNLLLVNKFLFKK